MPDVLALVHIDLIRVLVVMPAGRRSREFPDYSGSLVLRKYSSNDLHTYPSLKPVASLRNDAVS